LSLTAVMLLAVVHFSSRAMAQDELQRSFYGGVIAGLNFATIDNDNFTKYNKIGANIGGIVYARFTDKIALSMEILYSQKGRKTKDLTETGINGVLFTYIYDRLNYVEVPVMINFFDKHTNHFGVGMSYGRLVNSTEILHTDPFMTLDPDDYPFNKDDFEFVAGAQLKVWKNLFLNLRFQYSVVQIRTNVPTNFDPPEQNNNMVAVRLMYMVGRTVRD
jgi:opacity protein-like surface antigen